MKLINPNKQDIEHAFYNVVKKEPDKSVLWYLEGFKSVRADWDRGSMLWSIGFGDLKPSYDHDFEVAAMKALLVYNGAEFVYTQ